MRGSLLRWLLAGVASAGPLSVAPAQGAIGMPDEIPAIATPATQPPARLIVDAPVPDALASGRVVIQFTAVNVRLGPVYGPGALTVVPRIGHLHVSVDDALWHWTHASNEPLIINGLLPGAHTVLVTLVGPTHEVADSALVRFDIPSRPGPISPFAYDARVPDVIRASVPPDASRQARRELPAIAAPPSQPPPYLRVDTPLSEPLARGTAVVQYHVENMRIVPVYGAGALSVVPRVGHLHVTVDDGNWRWLESSGEPVILDGLPRGVHRLRIELEDPTHRTLARETVTFEIPPTRASPER